jgi:hypothetical protein
MGADVTTSEVDKEYAGGVGFGCLKMPFANDYERDIHFSKHGHSVGTASAVEYEAMAETFMFGAMTMAMRECTRGNATDRLRINMANYRFGVANIVPAFLKTFYTVPRHTIAHHGGTLAYFNYECGRTDL